MLRMILGRPDGEQLFVHYTSIQTQDAGKKVCNQENVRMEVLK
jgi:hypothetical protein